MFLDIFLFLRCLCDADHIVIRGLRVKQVNRGEIGKQVGDLLEKEKKKDRQSLGEEGRTAGVLLYRHTILPHMLLLKLLRLPGQFLQGNTNTTL